MGLGEFADASILKVLASQPRVAGWPRLSTFINIRESFAHFGLAHLDPFGARRGNDRNFGNASLLDKLKADSSMPLPNGSKRDSGRRQNAVLPGQDVLSYQSLIVASLMYSYIEQFQFQGLG